MLSEGMQINPTIHVRVLENKLSIAAVREASLEAGIQDVISQNQALLAHVKELEAKLPEVEDASSESEG